MKKEAPEQTTVLGQTPLSVRLDEIEKHWADLGNKYDVTTDLLALVKALRRANEIISECDPDTVYFWKVDIAAILNQK